jgi:hypothetical protein
MNRMDFLIAKLKAQQIIRAAKEAMQKTEIQDVPQPTQAKEETPVSGLPSDQPGG